MPVVLVFHDGQAVHSPAPAVSHEPLPSQSTTKNGWVRSVTVPPAVTLRTRIRYERPARAGSSGPWNVIVPANGQSGYGSGEPFTARLAPGRVNPLAVFTEEAGTPPTMSNRAVPS